MINNGIKDRDRDIQINGTVFFLKSAPGAFEIEIRLGFLTLQLAPPFY